MRAEAMRPPSTHSVTTVPASAKSPWRRAISSTDQPVFGASIGTRTSVRISAGSIAVVSAETKKSAAATLRSPPSLASRRVAPRASAAAGYSAAGSACAIDPPTVPRLRICGCAIKRVASKSSGWRVRTSAERSTVVLVVMAPIAIEPASSRT